MLLLDDVPHARLAALHLSDPSLADRVELMLDVLEADPLDVRVRTRSLQSAAAAAAGLVGPVWAFTVRGVSDDILVMWRESIEPPGTAVLFLDVDPF